MIFINKETKKDKEPNEYYGKMEDDAFLALLNAHMLGYHTPAKMEDQIKRLNKASLEGIVFA